MTQGYNQELPTEQSQSSTNTTQTRRRPSNSKRARRRDTDPTVIMPLKDFTSLLSKHRGSQIALDVYVELLPHQLASANTEQTKHAGTESIFGLANAVRDHITPATDYRWSQKKRRELANGAGTVVTYYCSQLEGEQSKHVQKTSKALGWRFGIMQRYHCNGWLHITVPNLVFDGSQQRVRVRITHDHPHPPPPSKFEVRDGRGRFVPGIKSNGEPVTDSPFFGTSNSSESVLQDAGPGTPPPKRAHSSPRQNPKHRLAPPPSNPPSISASPEYVDAPLPDPSDNILHTPSLHTHSSKSPGSVGSRPPELMFSRDFLMSIGRDVDTILHKALAGVDNERYAQFNSLFLQLHQLGETIRAENRAAGLPSSSLQPPPPS